MIRVKRALSLLSLGAIALTSLPCDATPPPAVFKDSAGNIYVHSGVTAGDHIPVKLTGQPYKKTYKAGACGQIVLKTSTKLPSLGNSVTINGTNTDVATVASGTSKCTSGAFSPAATSNFKDSKGAIVLVGYTANQSYQVAFNDVPDEFKQTVNACGVAIIKNNAKHTIGTALNINGTDYTVSSLPTAEPPLCRKVNGTATLYVPGSWSS